jgi:2-polyprenyl-3-methyl-5-hydroxy-6-metoxy-1,4-benzoquinol methylase
MSREFQDVPISTVQQYWNDRPCNIRHSPKPVGEREYFDEVEARKYFVEPHIPRFAEFPGWRGKRVLEVGCGIGTDTINFARAGAQVTAVDLSDRSLDIVRRRAEVYGLPNIRCVQANVEELGKVLPERDYDLVYSFGVIHHTPHPDVALGQLVAHLKPGGTLKIMVYHRHAWKVFAVVLRYGRGAFWRTEEIVARYSEAQEGCPVTYTYTRDEARRLVEGAGCRVQEVFVDHIFNWRIPDYVQYRYRRALPLALLPPALFRRLERRLGWHLCLTATAR